VGPAIDILNPILMARTPRTRSATTAWWLAGLIVLFIIVRLFVPQWLNSDAHSGPVILISIDTLRADRLPVYGYANGVTPNIDQLAADSVVFDSAWAQSPQTLPAHTSILTGLLPFEHGVRDNVGFTLDNDVPTLAERLSNAGYATGAFVSSFVLRRQVGLDRGFATYDDRLPAAAPDRPLGSVQRSGTDTVAAALAWLKAQPAPEYFLWLHLYEPHTPYTPTRMPASGDGYDGEVTDADRIVGTLISALAERDEYAGATIVLLSDHGEGLGDHGEDEHGVFLYRSTIQIPLLIKQPGGSGRGERVSTAVQQVDVSATLLDVLGLPALPNSRGRSLRAVLDDPAAGGVTLPPATIYAEALSARYHFGWSELYAITDERYRLIHAPTDELFDLQQDPGELTSVAGERPQVVTAMRGALDQLLAGQAVDEPSAVSAADRQRLAALGYVGSQSTLASAPADTRPDPKDKIDALRSYQRAAVLAGEGQWQEAAEAYRALLSAEPDLVDGWLQLAGLLDRIGRPTEALEAYRQVILRDAGSAAALTGAAAILIQLGRFDEARAHAELAIGVAPAPAHELLARLALQRRDPEAARTHARAAAEADPTLPMPDFVEGLILYNQGAYAAAVAPLQRAVAALEQRTEQMADVRYVLADALARQQRFAEAEPVFTAEIAAFPGHIRARTGLALLYWTTDRRTEAERELAALEALARRSGGAQAAQAAQQLQQIFRQR
jgi:arylsulfatase A-like enzyme/Tfp pilus assembly protein PilF